MTTLITKYLFLGFSLLLIFGFGCSSRKSLVRKSRLANIENWVCTYSESVAAEEISSFDLAVLDADSHPDLSRVKASGTLMLGYVSLGEAANYRWFWPRMAGKPWVLDKNPNWDSYMLDVRSPEWSALLLDEIIPAILRQGFDGLFLDTIDTAEYLELYHPPGKYPGSLVAMIDLIHQIRRRFPDIYIVANRGFAVLDEIATSIDGVLAESVFSDVDWKNKDSRLRQPSEYDATLKKLRHLQNVSGLTVFTLDYLAEASPDLIKRVVQRSRDYDFVPYISTPALDRILYFATGRPSGKGGPGGN